MELEVLMNVLGDYGFPAAVTFYLLYRMEKKLDQINRSVLLLYTHEKLNPDQSAVSLPSRSRRQ
ncbi:hypothetical protein CR205_01955 [Alteribacter lacisalsi]|uniref:YvrJ family protein n=1 Tax=Alteribacter lacisalsi TaxID=2045244 RepID=A0A2W0HBK1_9BACI|nr:YvrJ family protein [Alteribacter lacisalsi]PYZ97390.1 hypothetical protein CR205_01955 [Alteribacter lacisalsi]